MREKTLLTQMTQLLVSQRKAGGPVLPLIESARPGHGENLGRGQAARTAAE